MKVDKLVACPKCGKSLPSRKLLMLTNLNAITCPTCSSKLRVENKTASSGVGAVLGGLGGGLGALLAILWLVTGNIVFVGLIITDVVAVFLSAWMWELRYLKLKLDLPQIKT